MHLLACREPGAPRPLCGADPEPPLTSAERAWAWCAPCTRLRLCRACVLALSEERPQ